MKLLALPKAGQNLGREVVVIVSYLKLEKFASEKSRDKMLKKIDFMYVVFRRVFLLARFGVFFALVSAVEEFSIEKLNGYHSKDEMEE